jgi:lipoate-protein ligase A
LGKRNELLLGTKKISGTASHVFKNRVLHHGTLLFSSRIGALGKSLKVSKGRFDDRAVKSIPSPVTNISPFIVDKLSIEDFLSYLRQHILDSVKGSEKYQYNKQDIDQISGLRDSKFSTWEWNFGYSPRYQFNKSLKFRDGVITLHMNVEKGVIREVNIEGDFIGPKDIHGLEDLLVGTIHDPATLRLRLATVDVKEYITGLENEQLLSGLF